MRIDCIYELQRPRSVSSVVLAYHLIHYPIEMPFNTFANRADPDQAALVRAV